MKRTNKKILIAGDIMLDSYHFGKVERISPEAPVPVFLETGKKRYVPGGAANVAVNIAAIGIKISLCAVIGADRPGERLINLLKEHNVVTDYVVTEAGRMTTTKLRYIGPNNQQLMRADAENAEALPNDLLEKNFQELETKIGEYSLILLSDYCKGFLSEYVVQRFIALGKKAGIPVLIDVKEKKLEKYRGATLLKPNRKELSDITGMPTDTKSNAIKAAVWLCNNTDSKYVLTTLGAEGMVLVDRKGLIDDVKNTAHEVFDVTGAGDTAIAYFAAEIVKGTNVKEAVKIANYAAGVQVSKVGTSIVYPEEVEEAMCGDGREIRAKELNYYHPLGLSILERQRRNGRNVVFTNGCFDVLHIGHISYLRKARQLGDILVVGVNSDSSVKRLKGDNRPVNSLKDRMEMLSALDFVDYVIPFEEDTPERLIESVTPDVLVKGGDYKPEDIAGAEYVISHGGDVKVLPFVEGHSTSGIIKKIRGGDTVVVNRKKNSRKH